MMWLTGNTGNGKTGNTISTPNIISKIICWTSLSKIIIAISILATVQKSHWQNKWNHKDQSIEKKKLEFYPACHRFWTTNSCIQTLCIHPPFRNRMPNDIRLLYQNLNDAELLATFLLIYWKNIENSQIGSDSCGISHIFYIQIIRIASESHSFRTSRSIISVHILTDICWVCWYESQHMLICWV